MGVLNNNMSLLFSGPCFVSILGCLQDCHGQSFWVPSSSPQLPAGMRERPAVSQATEGSRDCSGVLGKTSLLITSEAGRRNLLKAQKRLEEEEVLSIPLAQGPKDLSGM